MAAQGAFAAHTKINDGVLDIHDGDASVEVQGAVAAHSMGQKLSQNMKDAFLEKCGLKYETRSLWPGKETKTVYQCVYQCVC